MAPIGQDSSLRWERQELRLPFYFVSCLNFMVFPLLPVSGAS
jgi:hypothetical protein